MSKLKDKVAVVIGGRAVIGIGTAQEFVAQGAKVIITGRDQKKIDEAVGMLGGDTVGIRADGANLVDTKNLVAKVKEQSGFIYILFVNAGVAMQQPVGQIIEATFDTIDDINFKGAVFTPEKFIPILRNEASIIHMTSDSAFTSSLGT